jgi:hypothetical protein
MAHWRTLSDLTFRLPSMSYPPPVSRSSWLDATWLLEFDLPEKNLFQRNNNVNYFFSIVPKSLRRGLRQARRGSYPRGLRLSVTHLLGQ